MARTVNEHEVKTQFSAVLAEVESGGEVVIARAGRPVARIVAAGPVTKKRTPGAWRGRVMIADDYDVPILMA